MNRSTLSRRSAPVMNQSIFPTYTRPPFLDPLAICIHHPVGQLEAEDASARGLDENFLFRKRHFKILISPRAVFFVI